MLDNRCYTIDDVAVQQFYQLPKDLVLNKQYKELTANAKIAYAILKDRYSLSVKNRWIDEYRQVYFLFSDSELAEILDMSVKSASRFKLELQKFGLIRMERQGFKQRNRIYLMKPESDIPYIETLEVSHINDRTKLSNHEWTELSNHEQTELSNQDRTKLSHLNNTYTNKLTSKLSNNYIDEEEGQVPSNNQDSINEKKQDLALVITTFEENIGKSNPLIRKDLQAWLHKLPTEVILSEIVYAAKNGAVSFTYVSQMLENNIQNGFLTIESVEQKRKDHEKKKKKTKVNHNTRKDKNTPEWLFTQKEERKNKGKEIEDEVTPEYEEKRKRLIESFQNK